MKNPDALRVTPAAEDLAVLVYEFTKTLPRDERFGLVSQMRKSARSVGANIFEGCGRSTDAAFVALVHNSLGSAWELESDMRLCRRLAFGDALQRDQLFST